MNGPAAGAFRERFGRDATAVASAGGRVNLIGEHTDYHEGFVFPAAIDLRATAAGAARDDGRVHIWSDNLGEAVEAVIDDLSPPEALSWRSYVLGPVWALREAGHAVRGADVWIRGDVPFGGGLSSSASIEVAVAGLVARLSGIALTRLEIALVAKRAENGFCHVPCGAMDQIASACGEPGRALLLDCRTLTYEAVPFPDAWAIVVADSGVKHSIAGGEYAKRQRECASGLAKVRRAFPEVRVGRDLTTDMLLAVRADLTDVEHRRLRHVATEDARCLAAREALVRGDATEVGRLLAGSHESLARDYEVSCPELDDLVEVATGCPGVVGARMTGGGFGGNTVNVVEAGAVAAFRQALEAGYRARTGRDTETRLVRPADGLVVADG